MRELVILCWGCVFLMYLSQTYRPVECLLEKRDSGKYFFLTRRIDIFLLISIIWLTCFSFLRTSYNDTSNYIWSFENAVSVSDGIAEGTFTDWTGNPWSMLYRSVIREITDNYHIYFFFPALMSCYSVVCLFKHYSVNPAFSLVIFFSLGTYVLYIAALKQCMAMFFLLMALPYAIEKKYIRFYLLVLVAIFFHTHAFMFAIVPMLLNKPWGKESWILLGATLFAMLTYDSTLGAFMEYAQSIGALVAEEEVFDEHQINILRVIVYWFPALLAFVFHSRLFYATTRAENLFVNMSMVSAFILTIGLVQGANLYARMAGYFEIATAVSVPWMIKKVFTRRSAHALTLIAGMLYLGYFLFEFGVSKDFGNNYSAISLLQFIQSLL